MSSFITDSRNAEIIRNRMLDLKALVLTLCHAEEQNTFSKGLGNPNHDKTSLTMRAKYTRTHDRSNECELGRQYYDICQVFIEALTKMFWIESARIAALEVFSDIHGVTVTGQKTERRGDRIGLQDYKFQCDWREELGIDMLVRISLRLTGGSEHVMTVDYVRAKEAIAA